MSYRYGRSSWSDNSGCGGIIFAAVIIVIMLVCSLAAVLHTTEYTNLTVTDKSYSGESDGYIVWFEDANGTQYEFENSDSLLRGKFNSGTIQGKLKEGCTYNITTTGWRIPLFSAYPNIIEYELVEDKE